MPQQQSGKYSEDDVQQPLQEAIVPPVATRPGIGEQLKGAATEAGQQLAQTGKGIMNLVTGPFIPSQSVPSILGEIIKTPLRELAGMPQPGKSVLTAPKDYIDRLAGAADVVIGGDPAAARAHSLQGQTGKSAADLFAVPLATAGIGGLLRQFAPVSAEAALPGQAKSFVKAVGTSGTRDIPEAARVAMPELQKTVALTGVPSSDVAGANKIVQGTFDRLERDFNGHFQPMVNDPAPTHDIVSRLRDLKRGHIKTSEAAQWNAAIDRKIEEYSQPFTFGELNEERMAARDRINTYYQKNPSAQGAAAGSNVDTAIDDAINQGTKDTIYSSMAGRYAGQVPPDYFKNLKQTESALYDLKDQLKPRSIWESNEQAKSRMERARAHVYLSSGGHSGGAIGGLSELIFPEYKSAQKAVGKAFKKPTSKTTKASIGTILGGRASEPSLAPDEEQR